MPPKITVYGARSMGPFVLVVGAREVAQKTMRGIWKFDKQWNGQTWIEPNAPNGLQFNDRLAALAYLEANHARLLDALP